MFRNKNNSAWIVSGVTIICILILAIIWKQGTKVSSSGSSTKRKVTMIQPENTIQYGRMVYEKYGCMMCHGVDGKSGIRNPNAMTAELVPPVIHVADSYKPQELKDFIRRGQPNIDKLKKDGPTPPFRMPSFGKWISDKELDALQIY